ncbi:MAG: hypothetical protein U1D55_19165 [Phycisphaerae bacterium]
MIPSLLELLPDQLAWQGRAADVALAGLPGVAAVCGFQDADGRTILVGFTQHLRRWALSRLADPQRAARGKADLAEISRRIVWRRVHCGLEARWVYYRVVRGLHPRDYRKRLTFGPAWFLRRSCAADVPEIEVSSRVYLDPGEFVGPWPTETDARECLHVLWDLFDLCRYPEEVRRTPGGRRCAYADMGRCDAPCDGSVPLATYAQRAAAAWRFASGGIKEWLSEADGRMRDAARKQNFERAALIKRQREAAARWSTRWAAAVYSANALTLALAIPATRRAACKLLLFDRGDFDDGPVVVNRALPVKGAAWFAGAAERSANREFQADAGAAMRRAEQTWLLAQFLHHREATRALVMRIGANSKEEFADRLGEFALQRSRKRDSGFTNRPTDMPTPPNASPA